MRFLLHYYDIFHVLSSSMNLPYSKKASLTYHKLNTLNHSCGK